MQGNIMAKDYATYIIRPLVRILMDNLENPFVRFPEEVWGMIIDEVENSKDIQSILTAYPALDVSSSFQRKKQFWLIGQIIQHLIDDGVDEKDILKLRLVCKPWLKRIDSFLERQQHTLVAYNPTVDKNTKDFWDPTLYLTRYDDYGVKEYLFKDYFGGVTLAVPMSEVEPDSVTKFCKSLRKTPPGRNPIPGRSFKLALGDEDNFGDVFEVGGYDEFLERYAEHIWYFSMYFVSNSLLEPMAPRFWSFWDDFVERFLPAFPNLKLLKVQAPFSDEYDPNREVEEPFAQLSFGSGSQLNLPHLETLHLNCEFEQLPENVAKYFLCRFATQLRRLELPIRYWKPEYFDIFKNLTELEITDVKEMLGNRTTAVTLRELLSSIQAPQLVKLQVKFSPLLSFILEIENDLFPWLKRFPKIKCVNFGDHCRSMEVMEEGKLSPFVNLPITTLEFLSIRDSHGMTYNFLRSFPFLRHLHIFAKSFAAVTDCSVENSQPSSIRIRDQIQTAKMYESNIWEHLPKLKTVSLLVEDFCGALEHHYYFERGTYEHLKKFGRVEPTPGKLRKDILDYLGFSSEEDEDDEDDGEEEEEDLSDDSDLYLPFEEDEN